MALLFPIVFLGVIDRAAHWGSIIESSRRPPQRLGFAVPIFFATLIAIVFPGAGFLRLLQVGAVLHLGTPDVRAWLIAIVAHVSFCTFLLSLFNLPESLFGKFSYRPSLRFLIHNLLVWILLQRIVQNVILSSVPFVSLASQIYAAAFALALLMMGGSLLWLIRQLRIQSGALAHADNSRLAAALALVLVACMYIMPAFIGMFDWNFLIRKTWTLFLWAAGFLTVLLWRKIRSPRPYPTAAMVAILVCSPLFYLFAVGHSADQPSSTAPSQMNNAMERHLGMDESYRVLQELWSWRKEKPCDDLCKYLLTQSNLPSSAQATAVDIKLAENPGPTPGKKPNIFIFVVDSLRQDYLSAYNPAVNFTPEIGKFAADSTVLRNAFTRYAGTTLSEPAIWSGTMLLHKTYLQPFHNMDSLEKLLDTDGYQRFITVDIPVLQVILRPTPDLVYLDQDAKRWTKVDFCSTLNEAESKFNQRADPNRPIFMFTMAKNIHTVTLSELPPDRAPKKAYPGFQAKTASELERMDGCFGNFVRYLKSSGLYSNSIIVLTSDHGDSFGEFGHQGHSLLVDPDVLKIPLIIHLPESMRKAYYSDLDQAAFNIDVTPTLYYLLGHGPIVNDPRFGRPLFTTTKAEAEQYRRDQYLVASSYGPIYGLLGNNGKNLFVANAIKGTNKYFDLTTDPEGGINRINQKILAADQKIVHDDVQDIANLYRYTYHAPTFMDWLMH
jgi:phosphoglycerol transferase MdoB-like AlkP superfamily enzyme